MLFRAYIRTFPEHFYWFRLQLFYFNPTKGNLTSFKVFNEHTQVMLVWIQPGNEDLITRESVVDCLLWRWTDIWPHILVWPKLADRFAFYPAFEFRIQVQVNFWNHDIIKNVRIIRNNMLKVQNLVGLPAEYLGLPQKDKTRSQLNYSN